MHVNANECVLQTPDCHVAYIPLEPSYDEEFIQASILYASLRLYFTHLNCTTSVHVCVSKYMYACRCYVTVRVQVQKEIHVIYSRIRLFHSQSIWSGNEFRDIIAHEGTTLTTFPPTLLF